MVRSLPCTSFSRALSPPPESSDSSLMQANSPASCDGCEQTLAGPFYDLGFDEAEACVLEMRADLMAALREPGTTAWSLYGRLRIRYERLEPASAQTNAPVPAVFWKSVCTLCALHNRSEIQPTDFLSILIGNRASSRKAATARFSVRSTKSITKSSVPDRSRRRGCAMRADPRRTRDPRDTVAGDSGDTHTATHADGVSIARVYEYNLKITNR